MRAYLQAFYAVDSDGNIEVLYLNKSWIVRDSSWASLSNSPYPGHVLGGAVDIYAPQPYMPAEEGKVLAVKKFPTPRNRVNSEEYDYLLLLQRDNIVIKILHVRPECHVGDYLRLGDLLGGYLDSGFFYPWTEPHMHVEIRSSDDPIRALGSHQLRIHPELLSYMSSLNCSKGDEFIVVGSFAGYPLAVPQDGGYFCSTAYGFQALVDGGIPHYGYGALIKRISEHISGSVAEDPFVYVGSNRIGEVIKVLDDRLIFKPSARPSVNGKILKGLGFYILRRAVKLIGVNTRLRAGDKVKIYWVPSTVIPNRFLHRFSSD